MPEVLSGIPPWGVALELIAIVVLIVLLIVFVFVGLGSAFRRTPDDDGPSLAESADPLLRSRTALGRFDGKFDRLIEGTQLGISGESAIGWILLTGALAAVVTFALTFDEIWTGGAFLIGGLLAFLFFAFLRNRRKRAIQEQLPDGCFQLARSLRAGLNLPDAMRETAAYLPLPLTKLFKRAATAVSLGESAGPALRPLSSTSVRLAPRPRRSIVWAPGPPLVTRFEESAAVICAEPAAIGDDCRVSAKSSLPSRFAILGSIDETGSGLVNSGCLMREPVTTIVVSSVSGEAAAVGI